jgi:hypothetical protein
MTFLSEFVRLDETIYDRPVRDPSDMNFEQAARG